MTNPLAHLEHDLEVLRANWSGALPAFGASDSRQASGGGASSGTAAMSDGGLVQVVTALVQLRRDVEALLAQAAAEVDRRSEPGFGVEGLAKQQGFRNGVQLLAATTGATTTDAARLVRVGAAARPRQSFTGESLPPRHPFVAAALGEGAISVDAADVISGMLDRVAPRAEPERAQHYEAELARFAGGVPLSLLTRAVKLAESRLDPDGIEPRDEALRAERSLVIHEEPSGMVRLQARLDPVTAAPIKAAIESLVSESIRRRNETARQASSGEGVERVERVEPADATGMPVLDDRRTIPQLQADALADLARHALGCTAIPESAKTTVVVRIDLDALRRGLGDASVDGFDRPISAGAARRLAADAELIPAVLGGESMPSTSVADAGSSPPRSALRWPNATAAARAAVATWPMSTHTISTGGSETPAPPTSTTV